MDETLTQFAARVLERTGVPLSAIPRVDKPLYPGEGHALCARKGTTVYFRGPPAYEAEDGTEMWEVSALVVYEDDEG